MFRPILSLLFCFIVVQAIHKDGYCAMYDNCGKRSFFGSELPCAKSVEAVVPDQESIELLSSICGKDFPTDKVCCSKDQLINLQSNLKKVDPLISSCPACRKNFFDFFCEFTCSSNQSMFVDILKTGVSLDKKEIVTELTQYVEPETASKFFQSCKNLKFSATNGYAMDLIGGGAKNFKQFLKFLGDEKPLLGGSPFQINFEYELKDKKEKGLVLRDTDMKDCNDTQYKCACSDCIESCPNLPYFNGLGEVCKVGSIHCFSFATIIVVVLLIILLGLFHVYIARSKRLKDDQGSELSVNETSDEDSVDDISSDPYTNFFKQLHLNLIANVEDVFANVSFFCSKYPGFTIGITLILSLLLSFGIKWLEFETNPVNLWVSPNEQQLKNYQYFEENFGEWFRIEQIIISNEDDSPILNWDTIKWWFEKELELQQFEDDEILSLQDFCYKPLGESCVIESFTQYFGGNVDYLTETNWDKQIKNCAESPVNCLPSFQQPLKPNLLFDDNDIINAKAFVVTLLLNKNLKDLNYTSRVEKYETKLKNWLLDLQSTNPHLNIAFSTEISLTEELNKSTNTDIKIIVISYLLMFLYASVSLGGKIPIKFKLNTLIHTRFLLGLGGIIIILISVTSSIGFFSLIGLKSTLIIAEVIPFLILAIGIDNIFLMVHELNLVTETSQELEVEERISKALVKIGPSCLISAIIQISMFLLASNVDMPAVKNFAIYSAGAIFINFLLQMTTFISLLSLDQQRLETGRLDCFPWITSKLDFDNTSHHLNLDFSGIIERYYAPKLLTRTTKPKILTIFILWLGVSLSLLPYIDLGLDQKIALPKESYLINYFDSVYKYLNVGPPVFFVIKDLDVTERSNQQKLCGKFSTCNEYSLSNIIEQEYKRSSKSTIIDPLSNWLDDYFLWLNPNLDQCCRVKKNSPHEFCSPNSPERLCQVCYDHHDPPYNITMEGLPEGKEFMYYFQEWIQLPSDPCPLGGKAPYGDSINYNNDSIITSYFRTSHSPLRSQKDFIIAFKNSLRLVDEINGYQQFKDDQVFAFSPFYIFFVQYETIIKLTFTLIAIALVIIWFMSLIFLGSIRCSIIFCVTISLILINIGGLLSIWNVSLNAISLVNLIICIGLAVEFCIHLTRGYLFTSHKLDDNLDVDDFKQYSAIKAYNSLINIGGSILGGITITKILGILVLAFTRSEIFEIYYFRMWFSLIIVAAVHSLCLLPILLSYFGD